MTAAHGRVKCQSDSLPPPELSSGPGCPGHRVPGLAAGNHTYTFGGRRLLLEGMHSGFLRGACCSLRVLNLLPPPPATILVVSRLGFILNTNAEAFDPPGLYPGVSKHFMTMLRFQPSGGSCQTAFEGIKERGNRKNIGSEKKLVQNEENKSSGGKCHEEPSKYALLSGGHSRASPRPLWQWGTLNGNKAREEIGKG